MSRASSRALFHWKAPILAGALLFLAGCAAAPKQGGGWYILRWIERTAANGPSHQALPEDRTEFVALLSYDRSSGPAEFEVVKARLQEGDVIAYRMDSWEARREILKGGLNKIGYRLLRYGHLAMVVRDPADPTRLRIFSSESFKGPNVREDIDSLMEHDWDAYRLDRHERLNRERLNEFVRESVRKAGKWYGYDFSGMFGVWNSNLRPQRPDEIGHEYICSSVVAVAFYYSGLELDAIRRQLGDLVTPQQVVSSRGRFIPAPEIAIEAETETGK